MILKHYRCLEKRFDRDDDSGSAHVDELGDQPDERSYQAVPRKLIRKFPRHGRD